MSVPEKHSDGRRTAVPARLMPKGTTGRKCNYCDGDGILFAVGAGASWDMKTCHICGGTGLMP